MTTTVKIPSSPDYGVALKNGDQVVQPAANARQGVIGHNVRYVLALGLSGGVIGLALVYLFFFA